MDVCEKPVSDCPSALKTVAVDEGTGKIPGWCTAWKVLVLIAEILDSSDMLKSNKYPRQVVL